MHDHARLDLGITFTSFDQSEEKVPILVSIQLVIPLHQFGGFASQHIGGGLRLITLPFKQIVRTALIGAKPPSRRQPVAFAIEDTHGTKAEIQLVILDKLNGVLNMMWLEFVV